MFISSKLYIIAWAIIELVKTTVPRSLATLLDKSNLVGTN